jgi:pSer/pThr/pTyr-binding forkhead associated (FHA) protein
MARRPRSLLFLPPRPPVPLRARGRLVLGRSRTCDLMLPGVDASRRHAEIRPLRGGFVLRDLDSTNGTFVNGERIDEHELEPGDCIQIGDSVVTFCQLQAEMGGADPDDEAKTVITDRPIRPEAFRGDLKEIPAFAVLQILELGNKTGRLVLESGQGKGRLWIRAGRPIHAEAEGRAGFDAAIEIARMSCGTFAFDPQDELPEATIDASMTELLLEGSRQLDEGTERV